MVERVSAKDGGLGGRRLLRSRGLRLESLLRLEGLLRLLLHWLRLETLLCWLSLSVLQLSQLHKAWECPWLLLLLLRLEVLLLDRCCLLEGLGRPWLLHWLRLEGLLGSESLLSRGCGLLEGLLGRLDPLREPLGRHRGLSGREELVSECAKALVDSEGAAGCLSGRLGCCRGCNREGKARGQGQIFWLGKSSLGGRHRSRCGSQPGLASSPRPHTIPPCSALLKQADSS